ncbi:SDR family oxidoreductase [Streptomyces sp. NPDC050211]|uniref:SDR family oxidoreductase n=1 Tax=Streptomyces sp. NPDC050211 TaxID=3154932 RepID=UPI0034436097
MRVVVVGGGFLSREAAAGVRNHGHEAVVVSDSSGVDAYRGVDLSETLDGCSVVIDLSDPLSLEDGIGADIDGLLLDDEATMEKVCRSTAKLLAAEAAAGVRHHVALSVVGMGRLQEHGYFRALQAQEDLIRQSPMPYSIISATQLFESVGDIADAATEDGNVWVAPVQVRPVSCGEVATLIAHTAAFKPLFGVLEIAGPDQFRLDTFVRAGLTAAGDHRRVFTDDRSTYFGARLRRSDLLPSPHAYITQIHYNKWLSRQLPSVAR